MNKLSLRLLCQVFLLPVLLAATVMAPLPCSLPALVMLLVMLFVTLRPRPPGINVAVHTAAVFLTPLVLAPPLNNLAALSTLAVPVISVVFTIPVIYLLDYHLRQNARATAISGREKPGRYVTNTCLSLLTACLIVMLLSRVVSSPVMLFTGIALLLYLMGVLTWTLLAVPGTPFAMAAVRKRIIAGARDSISLRITVRARTMMYGQFSLAESWIKIQPQRTVLDRGESSIELSFTPPLAGQSRPKLRVSATDPRGLFQVEQILEPLELHVIPRAKYAEWLARKYLEQTGAGAVTAAVMPAQTIKMPKRGIEYLDSRTYQPGDPLKDIDWKHTLKLSQLIVKEYTEAGEPAAIIAVNLSVTSAEEADILAFNLITVALTLARESVPAALAAYNHDSVILNTSVTDPTMILRQALALVREIRTVELADRHLEPADIARIRRNISRLKQAESEPSQRLLDVLSFEYRAIEEAARNHPANATLLAVTGKTQAPAMIFLVSQLNHDAEAVLVTAEKLSRRNFTTIPVEPIPR